MFDKRLSNVWLVSFGDSRLVKPRRRLLRQARDFGFADDHVLILNENGLGQCFRDRMNEHLVLGSRGFGYWCWKPEIILRQLERIPDGDILFYVDVGCHLNGRGKNRFYEYITTAKKEGLCAFQCRSLMSRPDPDPKHHYFTTAAFTKGDMLDYYGVRNNEFILNSGLVLAGILFLKKCKGTIRFCEEWQDVFLNHFNLVDDSPSKSPNVRNPCVHRHDQAALSILWLQRRYPTFSACEVEPARRWAPAPEEFRHNPKWGSSYFFQMRRFPILARRDKGQKSLLSRIYRHLKYYYVLPLLRRIGIQG